MSHPVMFDDQDPYLARVRDICLALPGADEKISHGRPNFFTRKVFATFGGSLKGDHYSPIARNAKIATRLPPRAPLTVLASCAACSRLRGPQRDPSFRTCERRR